MDFRLTGKVGGENKPKNGKITGKWLKWDFRAHFIFRPIFHPFPSEAKTYFSAFSVLHVNGIATLTKPRKLGVGWGVGRGRGGGPHKSPDD